MNCCAEDDIESLLQEDDSTFLESIRSKRLQELANCSHKKAEVEKLSLDANEVWGYLTEMSHEKEVMHLSTTLPRLLIHFYNPSFKNCQLLNEHLQKLARKFPATRFVYIEATKAPFLIVKMKIQVLPCLVCIVDSLAVDRLVGFDELGGTDQFTTKQLEDRLSSQSRILQIPLKLKKSADRRDRDSDSDYEE